MSLTDLQQKGIREFEKEFNARIKRVLEKHHKISDTRMKAREFVKKKFEREKIKNFYANDIILIDSYFKIKRNAKKKIKPELMKFIGLRYSVKSYKLKVKK
jgi:hypothetical protein